MYLAGTTHETGLHILVDTGATPNIIDINAVRLIGLPEKCIDTTMLVGSGTEVSCHATAFGIPLRINEEIFDIIAFLLDVDVILGTPLLANLG